LEATETSKENTKQEEKEIRGARKKNAINKTRNKMEHKGNNKCIMKKERSEEERVEEV